MQRRNFIKTAGLLGLGAASFPGKLVNAAEPAAAPLQIETAEPYGEITDDFSDAGLWDPIELEGGTFNGIIQRENENIIIAGGRSAGGYYNGKSTTYDNSVFRSEDGGEIYKKIAGEDWNSFEGFPTNLVETEEGRMYMVTNVSADINRKESVLWTSESGEFWEEIGDFKGPVVLQAIGERLHVVTADYPQEFAYESGDPVDVRSKLSPSGLLHTIESIDSFYIDSQGRRWAGIQPCASVIMTEDGYNWTDPVMLSPREGGQVARFYEKNEKILAGYSSDGSMIAEFDNEWNREAIRVDDKEWSVPVLIKPYGEKLLVGTVDPNILYIVDTEARTSEPVSKIDKPNNMKDALITDIGALTATGSGVFLSRNVKKPGQTPVMEWRMY